MDPGPSRQLRILLLAPHPFFQNRGTPIAVRLLLETLGPAGHQVDLLTYHEGEDLTIPNVTIKRIPSPPGIRDLPPGPSWKKLICDAVMTVQALRLARRNGYDLVHAVEESVFMAVLIKRLVGTPYVYDMDSCLSEQIIEKFKALSPLGGLMKFFEARAVKNSVGVLAVCRSLEEKARSFDPAKLIHRLEDISLLDREEAGPTPSAELLSLAGPAVMYVGNLERYQGIDLLLESFKLALKAVPEAQLVIIGGSPKDVAKYQETARRMGLEDHSHFLGPRPSSLLGHFLRQAEVVVSPRTQGQNTPMKIYSYLDSGRPLLATRLATHTQVLDQEIARLVEPEPESMARGLVELLQDGRLRSSLAARARERVKEEYSWAAFQRKLLAFYGRLEPFRAGG